MNSNLIFSGQYRSLKHLPKPLMVASITNSLCQQRMWYLNCYASLTATAAPLTFAVPVQRHSQAIDCHSCLTLYSFVFLLFPTAFVATGHHPFGWLIILTAGVTKCWKKPSISFCGKWHRSFSSWSQCKSPIEPRSENQKYDIQRI